MNKDSTKPNSTKPDTFRTGALDVTGAAARELSLFHPGDELLNTYRVESEALQGGMGSVWRVRHLHWNLDLAMKRPRSRAFQTEAQKESFTQECSYWIGLGLHPNIVSCYYVREITGVPSIFSQWVDGGSLSGHILNGSVYEGTDEQVGARLLDIAIQFARGLHYAHGYGLIHQDVKPDNLLVTSDWIAKVSDFGLARARSNLTLLEGDWTEWDENATVMLPSGGCTPAYCSPEQAGAQPLTRRTDLYSWAVSLVELYLGCKPWAHGRTCTGPLAGIACRDYFAMARVSMPEGLCELLEACLQQDPEQRPRDFSIVIERLKDIYRLATGKPYPRPAPSAAVNSAEDYNNRALSFLDLGDYDTALALWDKGLRMFPDTPLLVFNRTLARFRHELLSPWEVWENLEAITDVAVHNHYQQKLDREISKTVRLPRIRSHPFEEILDHSGDGRLITADSHFYQKAEDAPELDYTGIQAVYEPDRGEFLLAVRSIDYLRGHHIHQAKRSGITLSRNGRFAAYDLSRNRNGKDYPKGVWETHTVVTDLYRSAHKREWYLSRYAKEPIEIPDGPILREFDREGGRLSPDGSLIAFPAHGDTLASCSVSFFDVTSGSCLSQLSGAVLLGFTWSGEPMLYTAEGKVCWGGTAERPQPEKGPSVLCADLDWKAPLGSRFCQFSPGLAVVKQRTEDGYGAGLLLDLAGGCVRAPLRWRLGEECAEDSMDSFQCSGDGRWLCYLSRGFYRQDGRRFNTASVQVWDSATGRCEGRFFPVQEPIPPKEEGSSAKRKFSRWMTGCLLACLSDKSALRFLPENQADYILCRVTSTEDRLADQQRFEALLLRARKAMRQGELRTALKLTDEARGCAGFGIDPRALHLRSTIGAKLNKRMVRQIIPLPREAPAVLEQQYSLGPDEIDWNALAKSIEQRVEREWRTDGYYNEVRAYVRPADYSADGRYRLLNIMIAEDYTSPAQYDSEYPEDTRHTLGVALAETETGNILYQNKAMFRYDSHYTASFLTDFYHTDIHISHGDIWLLSRGNGTFLRRVGVRDVFRIDRGTCQHAAFLREERFLLARKGDWMWLYDVTGGKTLREAFPGQYEDDTTPGDWNTDADTVDVPVKDCERNYFSQKEYGPLRVINDNCFSIRHGDWNQLCWLDWIYEEEG